MKVTRYDQRPCDNCDYPRDRMETDEHGDFALYEDALREFNAEQDRADAAEAKLRHAEMRVKWLADALKAWRDSLSTDVRFNERPPIVPESEWLRQTRIARLHQYKVALARVNSLIRLVEQKFDDKQLELSLTEGKSNG